MIELKVLIIEQQEYLANLEVDFRDVNLSFVYSDFLSLDIVQQTQPNLILLDISLFPLKDAVYFCQKLNKRNIPFILLTNRYKYETYLNFQYTFPQTLLNRNDDTNLKIGISIVLQSLILEIKKSKNKLVKEELFFFIKDPSNQKERISINDILWVRSDGNYCYLQTEDRKHVMRKSLKQVKEKLPSNVFIQIFRGIIVQKDKIDRIDIQQNYVFIKEHSLPLGRKYKQKIINEFNLL